jgi:hypothetical protein
MVEQISSQTSKHAAELEALMALTESTNDPLGSLLCEHLKSARAYRLGTMHAEYLSALVLAQTCAHELLDHPVRDRLQKRIATLITEAPSAKTSDASWKHHSQHPGSDPGNASNGSKDAADLAAFFAESVTSLGVFYPTNYILCIFPSFEAAKEAHRTLKEAGFGSDEIHAADGAELLAFVDRLRSECGITGEFMTRFSRALGTEATFVDNDVRWAEAGAGFVAILCRTEPESEHITQLVTQLHPIEMQWYLPGGIRSLV